jgi:hypothetical protein
MANFLSKMKSAVPHISERKSSFMSLVVDKGERYGASLGFGFVKGYYREKAAFKGVPVDALVGGLALVGAVVAETMSSGRSNLAPHLNALGDAGLQSYLNSIGASLGAKKSGRKVYVLDAGAKAPAALPPGMTAVGASDGLGAWLSPEEVSNYSAQR